MTKFKQKIWRSFLSIVAKPSFFNQWNYKNQTLDSLTFFKKPFKINSYIFNFPSLYFTIRVNQTKKKFHVIEMVNPMKLQWIALSDQICILFTLKIIAIQDILLLMLPKINERWMLSPPGRYPMIVNCLLCMLRCSWYYWWICLLLKAKLPNMFNRMNRTEFVVKKICKCCFCSNVLLLLMSLNHHEMVNFRWCKYKL